MLPFSDLSPKKDQGYFSDGLTEELTGLLAKNPKLRMTSRTCAFSFKGKDVDMKMIGEKLKVTHVLEGSVRKAGDQLRITAQLIEVRTDSHVWSQTYDRPLENISAVQDEIAGSVTAELKATLEKGSLQKDKKRRRKSTTCVCWEGISMTTRKTKGNALKRVPTTFTRQLPLIQTMQGLGNTQAYQMYLGFVPADEGYAWALKAIEKSLELDRMLGSAYETLGRLKMHHDRDWAGARAAFKKAIELEPGNEMAMVGAAELASAFGDFEEAIRPQLRAINVNPVKARPYRDLV